MEHRMQIVYVPRFDYDRCAEERRDGNHAATEAVVGRWTGMFGSPSRDLDFEDWHEAAHILLAAIDSGLPIYAMAYARGDLRTHAAFNTDRTEPHPDLPTIALGMTDAGPFSSGIASRTSLPIVWPIPAERAAAERYHANAGFVAHAGRACAIGTCDDEAADDAPGSLLAAIRDVRRRIAGDELVLKVMTRIKYSTPTTISIPDPDDVPAIRTALFDALGWDLVHTDGVPVYLVQELIGMNHEYRTVVIGGKVVAGAGCVESHIPACKDGPGAFDAKTEPRRNQGGVADHGLASGYAAFAQGVADAMRAADPDMLSGTIDLATGAEGMPLVIETNPASQFGLYAIDFRDVLTAIVAHADSRLPATDGGTARCPTWRQKLPDTLHLRPTCDMAVSPEELVHMLGAAEATEADFSQEPADGARETATNRATASD